MYCSNKGHFKSYAENETYSAVKDSKIFVPNSSKRRCSFLVQFQNEQRLKYACFVYGLVQLKLHHITLLLVYFVFLY